VAVPEEAVRFGSPFLVAMKIASTMNTITTATPPTRSAVLDDRGAVCRVEAKRRASGAGGPLHPVPALGPAIAGEAETTPIPALGVLRVGTIRVEEVRFPGALGTSRLTFDAPV